MRQTNLNNQHPLLGRRRLRLWRRRRGAARASRGRRGVEPDGPVQPGAAGDAVGGQGAHQDQQPRRRQRRRRRRRVHLHRPKVGFEVKPKSFRLVANIDFCVFHINFVPMI